MDRGKIGDALDALTARELEGLRGDIDRRLQACVACGRDGALVVRARTAGKVEISLLVCEPCIEKHRRPVGRSTTGPG